MNVQTAAFQDAGAITDIFNQSVRAGARSPVIVPMTEADGQTMLKLFERGKLPLWTCRHLGAVVGWLALNRFSWGTQACRFTGEISVYVAESFQRRGVARMLMAHAFTEAPRYGFTQLAAWVFAANQPSLQLMESFGMHRWGYLPGIAYFPHQGLQDVMIFGKSLSSK